MTELTDTAEDTLNAQDLARWLDSEGFAGQGDLPEISRLTGGSQNELFLITRGGEQAALRKPPSAAGLKRHDGLRRELTLLRGLRGTEVPHAELIAGCESADVIGTPFYLMRVIDGWSPSGTDGWPEPYDTHPDQRDPLAYGIVEGAALLAKVDYKAQGLADFGRPDGFHDRQVDRWLSFLDAYKFRDMPGLDEATTWLRKNRPHHWSPGIMHGDYQFANVMFTHDRPTQLAAVIDWEMTTIGDPLLDLAWALIAWAPEGDDMVNIRYMDLDGMPARDNLLEHYESISGRSTEDFDYYLVLARWKLGIVLEMSYARFAQGGTVNPGIETFGETVLELIRKAGELSRTATAKPV